MKKRIITALLSISIVMSMWTPVAADPLPEANSQEEPAAETIVEATEEAADDESDVVSESADQEAAQAPVEESAGEEEILLQEGTGDEEAEVSEEAEEELAKSDDDASESKTVKGFVTRLYQKMMNRDPDSKGLNDWINAIDNGWTGADTVYGFWTSKEFTSMQAKMSDTEYVTHMYRTIMDREPDLKGLATWVGFLGDGYTRKFVLEGFLNSTEFKNLCQNMQVNPGSYSSDELRDREPKKAQFVRRLYQLMMGREPDKGGWNTWIDQLKKGKTGSEIVQGFYFSTEFQGMMKTATDKDYVTRMYRVLLDREADAGGLKTWTGSLDKGCTRKYVLQGFVNSTEFDKLCKDMGVTRGTYTSDEIVDKMPNTTAFVQQVFKGGLGRKGSTAELTDWVNKLAVTKAKSGVDCVKEVIQSTEGKRHNTDNTTFVQNLYKAALGRSGDSKGVADWADYLNQGNSREDAIKLFLTNSEFATVCKTAGIKVKNDTVRDLYPQAAAVLDQVGWNFYAAYKWCVNLRFVDVYWGPEAGTRAMANTGFTQGIGDCYIMAACLTEMGKCLGYDIHQISGSVPLARGGVGPHSWTEVVQNGTVYVCDPDFEYDAKGNGYMFAYRTPGTWRYTNGVRMN